MSDADGTNTGRPRRALVRPPGDSFVHAVSTHPERATIDPDKARVQHAEYRRLLAALGLEVILLPIDEDYPDSCFTQDVAVIVGHAALMARPGEPSRRGEEAAMAPVLARFVARLEAMEYPATLEGGDVMAIDRRLLVGRSLRTNAAGAERLATVARSSGREVMPVAVPEGILHLQSGATAVTPTLVLGRGAVLEQPAFDGLDKIAVVEDEAEAANVLALGKDIVMPAGFAATRRALNARGFAVHEVDVSEFLKANGGVSCLALLV